MKKEPIKLRKLAMLEALKNQVGVVTPAAEEARIDRSTHYAWLSKDKRYRKAVENLKEVALDFAEHALFKQMKKGSSQATTFFLRTKGRRRGYIEKQEVEHSGGQQITFQEVVLSDKEIKESKNAKEDNL